MLNAAHEIKDMNFPGAELHLLKGKYSNFWAIKINGNWRIIFKFKDGNAYDIDYLDYH